jgi:hypothetical protein
MNKPTAKVLKFPTDLATQLRFDSARPLSMFALPMAGSYTAAFAHLSNPGQTVQAHGLGYGYSFGAHTLQPPAWMSAPLVEPQPLMHRAHSQAQWRSIVELPLLAQIVVLDHAFDQPADAGPTVLAALEQSEIIVQVALMKSAIESRE